MKFASYIIHLICHAPEVDNEFEQVMLFDDIFAALADNPMLGGGVLADTVAPVENYLSLRPENFDVLARFAVEGRVEFGPWLVAPEQSSLESLIRNLLLGTETLRLLKMPVNVAALTPHASPKTEEGLMLPQILRGFGISAVIVPESEHTADFWIGLDGSAVGRLAVHPVEQWSSQRSLFAETAAGRHLLAGVTGKPADWLHALNQLRELLPKDDVFFSSRAGSAKASLASMPLPTTIQEIIEQNREKVGMPGIGESAVEKLLRDVEFLTAYENFPLKNPQRFLQKLWHDFLTGDSEIEKRVQRLRSMYPDPVPELVTVNTDSFEITTVKLREDGQTGIVVRGYNRTGEAQRVKLHFWQPLTRCDVLHMDESRTGGQLYIDAQGTIEFTAHPHRILTLGLYG